MPLDLWVLTIVIVSSSILDLPVCLSLIVLLYTTWPGCFLLIFRFFPNILLILAFRSFHFSSFLSSLSEAPHPMA